MTEYRGSGEIRLIFPYAMGTIVIPRTSVYSIHASFTKYENSAYDLSDIIVTTPSLKFTVEKVYQGDLWVDAIISYIDRNSESLFISCKVADLADGITADTDSFMESEFVIDSVF